MAEMRPATRPEMHQAEHHGAHGEDGMTSEQRREMLDKHHRQTLWIPWTLVLLGIWLMATPLTFGYGTGVVHPAGGREVWLSLAQRIQLMTWSDLCTGALLVLFAWRTRRPDRPYSMWACCFLGIWLSVAPILFWAPTAVAYLNDTLVGVLVIALSILIPGMPNMVMFMQMGHATPPGWSYNPSSWAQRWIMIATGFAGWLVSRSLAAYQLGYTDVAWDPVFGAGTTAVLNSWVSHSWPISDAALGTLAYTFEFLMGFMGSPARWRTMPWMVTFFGFLVIPLGLTHILLVISQPVLVHHWCLLCLLAAGIMLPMIPLEFDEVVAMGQHMVEAKRRGDRGGSLWAIFWKGGSAEGCTPDDRMPSPIQTWPLLRASIVGMSCPWTLGVSALLGAWLMLSPALLGVSIQTPVADVQHLGGALILTVAVISMGEVARAGRWLNVLLGLGVAVGSWVATGGNLGSSLSGCLAGLLAAGLAIPRGAIRERYGLWQRFVR